MVQERWVPLSMLETFCSGSVIYSPLSTDLKSSQVTATLPPLLRPLFYPLAALVEPSLLQDLASHLGVPEEERDMVTALCELEGGADIRSQLRDVLFGGRGEGIQDETREMLDYMGVSVISLLPLVMACLTDSAVRRASTLVSGWCICMCACVRTVLFPFHYHFLGMVCSCCFFTQNWDWKLTLICCLYRVAEVHTCT